MADIIRYDLLVQDALRGVVRKVLSDVAQSGLPGEHHFNISFKTHAPGVQLSARMRNQYPAEMTIILQYQFWGLKVTDQGFEVGLSFNKIPETLIIPYDALTGFYDPSVPFGLKFETEIGANDVDEPLDLASREADAANGSELVSSETQKGQSSSALGRPPAAAASEDNADNVTDPSAAKVISFDAFRKKP